MPLIVKRWTIKEESQLRWPGNIRHLSIFLLTRPSTSIHYFVKFFSGRICTPQPTRQRLLDEGASWSLKGKVEVYVYAHRYKLGHGKENIWSHIRNDRKAEIFHEYYALSQESCYPSMFSCSPVILVDEETNICTENTTLGKPMLSLFPFQRLSIALCTHKHADIPCSAFSLQLLKRMLQLLLAKIRPTKLILTAGADGRELFIT